MMPSPLSPAAVLARLLPLVALPFGTLAASPLGEFLGGAGKVVWLQAVNDEGNKDCFGIKGQHRLMGQSTADTQPIEFLAGPASLRKPLMVPDGSGVVVTQFDAETHVHLSWDQPGVLSEPLPGMALDIWKSPQDGKIWVYVGESVLSKDSQVNVAQVVRYQLGKPETRELVWDRTRVSIDNFQVSGDGTHFSGVFPWPHAGVGDLAGGAWEKYEQGCWPSISPDTTPLAWVFDGPHRNLTFFHRDPDHRWVVPVDALPELSGHEMYHPRWSNHPSLLAISGPYKKEGDGPGPAVESGGGAVEIYLGRFADDFSSLGKMFRLTDNEWGDFAPDLWVDGGGAVALDAAAITAGKPEGSPLSSRALKGWPMAGAVYAWETARATNEVASNPDDPKSAQISSQLTLGGAALLGSNYDLILGKGTAEASVEAAAHVLKRVAEAGAFTIECTPTSKNFEERPDAVLLELGDKKLGPLLQIAQKAGQVSFALRTSESGEQLDFLQGSNPTWYAWDAPLHLVLRLNGPYVSVLADGNNWCGQEITGDLSPWKNATEPYLIFGAKADGSAAWDGLLEKIAIYPRAISDEDLQAQSLTVLYSLNGRKRPERSKVSAKLLRIAPNPEVEDLGAYRRALVAYEYEVTAVHSGAVQPGRIEVRHYAILDRTPLDGFPREVGQSYELSLESWDAHPQAGSDRISELEGELSLLPTYLDTEVSLGSGG